MFSFKGRVSRSKFWWMFLLSTVLSFVFIIFNILALPALIFIGVFSTTIASVLSLLLYVLVVPMWWVSVAVIVKRFHDRNKSGWWYFLAFIPFVGFIWIIIECGFLRGTAGANSFGEDPLMINQTPFVPTQTVSVEQPSQTTNMSQPVSVSGNSPLKVILIVLAVLLILGSGFGFWEYKHSKDLAAENLAKVKLAAIQNNLSPEVPAAELNSTSTLNLQVNEQVSNTQNTSAPVTKKDIKISGLNYTKISVAELEKYKDKALSFKIDSNGTGPECVYNESRFFYTKTGLDQDTYTNYNCNVDSGVFSDGNFFGNLAVSLYPEYLISEGIEYMTMDFYIKDSLGKESNRLRITFTR